MPSDVNQSSLSLYIHWPFCVSKCPYCDFNSHIRQEIDETQWLEGYVREIKAYREITGPRILKSIFFGGGTPSLMDPRTVDGILTEARKLWACSQTIEITLEANPNSVEVTKFKDLGQAGINRVSLGIQSLRTEDLHFLGRAHSVEEGKKAIETAQYAFNRVSFDLIYARPHQTLDQWKTELKEALAFGTEHLSLYQLTIEPGTAFAHRYARGDFQLPNEEESAELYEYTAQACLEKGLHDYEISNYARVSAESQHNLTYWRYDDYIGIGPGAHGRLTLPSQGKVATKQYRAPQTWLTKAFDQEESSRDFLTKATQETEILDLSQQVDEMLLMGLRLKEPFDLERLTLPWRDVINQQAIDRLAKANLIEFDEKYVKLTSSARLCLNEILRQLRSD